MFDDYEKMANEKSEAQYSDEIENPESRRVRVRKRQYNDGDSEEVELRGREKFKIETYLPILDKLCAELSRRMDAYNKVNFIFGFLVQLPSKTNSEIKEAAQRFREIYPGDIELEFLDEIFSFQTFYITVRTRRF